MGYILFYMDVIVLVSLLPHIGRNKPLHRRCVEIAHEDLGCQATFCIASDDALPDVTLFGRLFDVIDNKSPLNCRKGAANATEKRINKE